MLLSPPPPQWFRQSFFPLKIVYNKDEKSGFYLNCFKLIHDRWFSAGCCGREGGGDFNGLKANNL